MSGAGLFLRLFFATVLALLVFDRLSRGRRHPPLTRICRAGFALFTAVTLVSLIGFATSYQHSDELVINQGDGRLWLLNSRQGRLRVLWASEWHDPYAKIEHSRLESLTTFYVGRVEPLEIASHWSSLERSSGLLRPDPIGIRQIRPSAYRAVDFHWLLPLAPASAGPLLGCFALAHRAWKKRVRERRARSRQCRQCGYDVRATARECPECGTPVHAVHNVIPFLVQPASRDRKDDSSDSSTSTASPG